MENVRLAQNQIKAACGRFYSPDKISHIRQEVNKGHYTCVHSSYQHKVYLDRVNHLAVRVPSDQKEIIDRLRGFEKKHGKHFFDADLEENIPKGMIKTLSAYLPVLERGGQHIWPMDLAIDVTLAVGEQTIHAPVAVAQKQFINRENGVNCSHLAWGSQEKALTGFLWEYFGTIYNLARFGLYVEDWTNFENAVVPASNIPQGLKSTAIAFIDPFFCRTDLDGLKYALKYLVSTTLKQLELNGFPRYDLVVQTFFDFFSRYDLVGDFGTDIDKAQRAPSCFG